MFLNVVLETVIDECSSLHKVVSSYVKSAQAVVLIQRKADYLALYCWSFAQLGATEQRSIFT